LINAAQIFWGIWLLPVALLIYRSRFLPRFVAVWLTLNGFAYVAMSIAVLMFPRYAGKVSSILFPALRGELVLMLWLIIRGAGPVGSRQEQEAGLGGSERL
jgi:membrane protein implicated in regulation of membrane protease activity